MMVDLHFDQNSNILRCSVCSDSRLNELKFIADMLLRGIVPYINILKKFSLLRRFNSKGINFHGNLVFWFLKVLAKSSKIIFTKNLNKWLYFSSLELTLTFIDIESIITKIFIDIKSNIALCKERAGMLCNPFFPKSHLLNRCSRKLLNFDLFTEIICVPFG